MDSSKVLELGLCPHQYTGAQAGRNQMSYAGVWASELDLVLAAAAAGGGKGLGEEGGRRRTEEGTVGR